jgi:hypothetical protein
MRAADEELLGSWASITADLIAFCRSKNQSVCTKIADVLDSMIDFNDPLTDNPLPPAIAEMMAVSTRAHGYLESTPQAEVDFATSVIKGERMVAILGRFAPTEAHDKPEPIVLPDLRTPTDYASAPCKHECAVLKQSRHVR